ncbi:MAG TPA: DUF3048 domain-containing protein [Patescibacteria group bacterium]|nr:DUF3048 domain-containing protein [Patescibacteria group bacterium]
MEEKKKTILMRVLAVLLLFGVSFGLSFGTTRYLNTTSEAGNLQSPLSEDKDTTDLGPKDTPSPLNGAYYTKQHAAFWSERRPLAIMVENHTQARPQSGLTSADVIYEAVAEGGITRFMAVYFAEEPEMVGPIRSARTYYIDWLSEYDALYAHVGGANTPGPANALGQIREYGIRDLDYMSRGYPLYERLRDRLPGVATEHTVYGYPTAMWAQGAKQGSGAVDSDTGKRWDENFRSWKFKDDAPESERPSSQVVDLQFWTGYSDYSVRWEYDKSTNSYKRFNGGQPFIDKNTDQQLAAKTVVVQVMKESAARDGYEHGTHLLYKTIGSGKATVFANGKATEGTWKKDKRASRTLFFDAAGNEIELARGLIWITTLPDFGEMTVQ